MKILRCCCSNPTGGKLFAINLLFTTKQYKVDNIVNFVYYGKTRMIPFPSTHGLVYLRPTSENIYPQLNIVIFVTFTVPSTVLKSNILPVQGYYSSDFLF